MMEGLFIGHYPGSSSLRGKGGCNRTLLPNPTPTPGRSRLQVRYENALSRSTTLSPPLGKESGIGIFPNELSGDLRVKLNKLEPLNLPAEYKNVQIVVKQKDQILYRTRFDVTPENIKDVNIDIVLCNIIPNSVITMLLVFTSESKNILSNKNKILGSDSNIGKMGLGFHSSSTGTLNFILGKQNTHVRGSRALKAMMNRIMCKGRFINNFFSHFNRNRSPYYRQNFSFSTTSVRDFLQSLNIAEIEWPSSFVNLLLERSTLRSIPVTCKARYLELGHNTNEDDSVAATVGFMCTFIPYLKNINVSNSILYIPHQTQDSVIGLLYGRVLVYNNKKKTWDPRTWKVSDGCISSYIEQESTNSLPVSEKIFMHQYTLIDSKLQLTGVNSIKSSFWGECFDIYGPTACSEQTDNTIDDGVNLTRSTTPPAYIKLLTSRGKIRFCPVDSNYRALTMCIWARYLESIREETAQK